MTATDLAVVDHASALPVFTGRDMIAALGAYRQLQIALDSVMPDAIIQLEGRAVRKKAYWRAVAVAFNLDVDCVLETREIVGTLPNNAGDDYSYRVTYRARAASGRSAIGDGTCTAAEKSKGRMRATEHNVRSHAHTRAYNRAVSNLCGFGEVSAEETDDAEDLRAHEAELARHDAPPPGDRDAPPTTPRLVDRASARGLARGAYRTLEAFGRDGEWCSILWDGGQYKTRKAELVAKLSDAWRDKIPIVITSIPNKTKGQPDYVESVVYQPMAEQAAAHADPLGTPPV